MGRLKGLLTGGLVGLVAGVLLAPKKGEETRQELKEKADKLNQDTQGLQQTVREKATELINKAKELLKK